MNYWTELSIEYANRRAYLDDLFQVYPTIPEGIRTIDEAKWQKVETAFNEKDDLSLLKELLKLDLFPIKDSYVAFLKRDSESLQRNPKTVRRICGRIYEIGLSKLWERCSEPKETNRQIGPFFKRWLGTKALGLTPVRYDAFTASTDDAILDAGDAELMRFAQENLNYSRNKGLDFVARMNGKYVIGEAKFLTDFGGHQNAQFNDAVSILTVPNLKAIPIAILDGVLYIKSGNKLYKEITERYSEFNIMSALVLREFLYQL